MFSFWREATSEAKRALVAAGRGWMLDAFDVMLSSLAVFRIFLGLGIGGEWASGAALVSQTWPAQHRGKALGLMQSCWAIGYGAAAIVTALVLPRYGWRAVFFVGILPALLTLWIRQYVREPALWQQTRQQDRSLPITAEIYPTHIRATAQGFTYNIGRLGSAIAPFAVGSLAAGRGFTAAFSVTSAAFLIAALLWVWIPETRGRTLE